MSRQTHYDVLGVLATADASTIRDAYRRCAREHHPDRTASQPAGNLDETMPRINEAYRVLNDPGRRAIYDAELRGGPRPDARRGPAAPAPPRSADHRAARDEAGVDADQDMRANAYASHQGPARVPWRSLLFVGTLAVVAIVALAQFTEEPGPRGPDGIIEIGSCVSIEPNGDAREVACTDDPSADVVVEAFVPFASSCPTGTLAHRDRQGMGIACIAANGVIRG